MNLPSSSKDHQWQDQNLVFQLQDVQLAVSLMPNRARIPLPRFLIGRLLRGGKQKYPLGAKVTSAHYRPIVVLHAMEFVHVALTPPWIQEVETTSEASPDVRQSPPR